MKRVVALVVAILMLAMLVVVFGPRIQRSWQLSRSRSRWQAAGVSDYRFKVDTECFGMCTNGDTLTVRVRDGQPVRAVSETPAHAQTYAPRTIDDLFDQVAEMRGADHFAVTYDERYGYPIRGAFDPSSAYDDEWGFTVTSFTPAAPATTA